MSKVVGPEDPEPGGETKERRSHCRPSEGLEQLELYAMRETD